MSPAPLAAPSVVVIDDEERMGQVLGMVLGRAGLAVASFTDGREAMEYMREHTVDAVVTDLTMPVMDGLEVLEAVKGHDPEIPVILITAHATVPSALAAMKKGAFDYVIKPFDNDDLKNIVGNALRIRALARENRYLRTELRSRHLVEGVVGESRAMQEIFDMVQRVAASKATVLVVGESGTGKELVARAIHYQSPRVGKPFVAINMKALAESLLEPEMFGHEKGAFTGAHQRKMGRFELADGGTIFLDEIGEISETFQAKLLRVLQLGEFERVGGTRTLRVDVRVVAATNRDLKAEVGAGRFREDLFFRLNVIPIRIPPLRERREDILPLARHFLDRHRRQMEKAIDGFQPEVEGFLETYDWPGNVRELENALERGVVLARGRLLAMDDLLMAAAPAPAASGAGRDLPTLQDHLDEAAASHIERVLQSCGGTRVRAAEVLGVNRATLYRLMKKYGLDSPGE